jgi:hypothetical protein
LINQKSRTIGRSFRLNEQWLRILNEEAKNEKISPNALLNRVLQDYCSFDRHLKRFPVSILGQESLSNIIGDCTKENLRLYGKQAGSTIAKDIFGMLGINFSKENIIFCIKDILGNYSNWFIYNHHINNGKDVFHLRHNMGENWSLFVSEAVSTLLEHCSGQKVRKEFTKSTVTLEIALDKKPCT